MPHTGLIDKRNRDALWSARAATLALGLALVIWGIAPAVLFRVTTSEPPPWGLTLGCLVIAGFGGGLAILACLLRETRRWAFWTALGIALLILAGTTVTHFLGRAPTLILFPVLLSLAVIATNGLALLAMRPTGEHPDAPASA